MVIADSGDWPRRRPFLSTLADKRKAHFVVAFAPGVEILEAPVVAIFVEQPVERADGSLIVLAARYPRIEDRQQHHLGALHNSIVVGAKGLVPDRTITGLARPGWQIEMIGPAALGGFASNGRAERYVFSYLLHQVFGRHFHILTVGLGGSFSCAITRTILTSLTFFPAASTARIMRMTSPRPRGACTVALASRGGRAVMMRLSRRHLLDFACARGVPPAASLSAPAAYALAGARPRAPRCTWTSANHSRWSGCPSGRVNGAPKSTPAFAAAASVAS